VPIGSSHTWINVVKSDSAEHRAPQHYEDQNAPMHRGIIGQPSTSCVVELQDSEWRSAGTHPCFSTLSIALLIQRHRLLRKSSVSFCFVLLFSFYFFFFLFSFLFSFCFFLFSCFLCFIWFSRLEKLTHE
jgi:hypothetical protein